jgi:hypothetical protein
MAYEYNETAWIQGGRSCDHLIAALDEARRQIDRSRRFVVELRRRNMAVNSELPADRPAESEKVLPMIYWGVMSEVEQLETVLYALNEKITGAVQAAQTILGDWTPEE